MDCKSKLERLFRDEGVRYETMTHPVAYTAQEAAAAQHVSGHQVAKVVIVVADGQLLMLALPASARIDFPRLKTTLGAEAVRLAREEEFNVVFPDCVTGAMPPFGNLYGVPVYADRALSRVDEIVFPAGTHRDTMKIATPDFERLARPTVAEFAVQP
jgi:Ala-tRNA(Pro) deacylase